MPRPITDPLTSARPRRPARFPALSPALVPALPLALPLALLLLGLPRPAAAQPGPAAAAASAVKPPGFAAIQALCHKALKLHGAKAVSPGLALGDGRFATVVRHHDQKKSGWKLNLLLLRQQGEAWSVVQQDALPLLGEARSGNPHTAAALCSIEEDRSPTAALFVQDYDKDGQPELLVRWKLCWLLPGLGGTDVRVMRLYNLPAAGALRPAFHLEIEHDARPTAAGRTLGRYTFTDLDKDGHPDLLVRFESNDIDFAREDELDCVELWERRFSWRAAGDRWVESGPGGKPKKRPRRCRKRAP